MTQPGGLTPADFGGYFSALWTRPGSVVDPFPWQLELVEAIHQERRWPDVLDLPTGTGKTSLVDIAVFLQALGGEELPSARWHPRRVVMVVDRRVVVDQAAERAARIAARLKEARNGVLKAVADQLRSLALGPDGRPPEVPLRYSVLRGGIVRDESWAQRPDVPAVLASTVDQVGSRLLFRGYGVSRGMRPVHAGLLGEDALYLLDEVHLARPYAETLQAIQRYRHVARPPAALPDRWQVVQLSATIDRPEGWVFPGRELGLGTHPVLDRRLSARKPAALHEVAAPADAARSQRRIAAECATRADALVAAGAKAVAVIVNRVATARHAYADLRKRRPDLDALLLTGRMRPVDKDRRVGELVQRVGMGRARQASDPPIVIVSTQSIEAGADFDLDAIVTECASLDALRQRFGRVDRDGVVSAAGTPFRSVVVASSRDVAPGATDAVYGESLVATWDWLRSRDEIDFGQRSLEPPVGDVLQPLLPHSRRAPIMLPSHLDRWARTSDYGVAADPEVAQWLHGIDASTEATDVSVVWRDDLDAALLAAAGSANVAGSEELARGVRGRINALPPSAEEALSVPLGGVRRWLRGSPEDLTLSDAWSRAETEEPPRSDVRRSHVVRWRDEQAELIDSGAVEPGDLIVVPATWGGLTEGTWDPTSAIAVRDVATEAASAGRLVLRLSKGADRRWREASRGVSADESSDGSLDLAPLPALPDPEQLSELPKSEQDATVRAYLVALADVAEIESATRDLIVRVASADSWIVQALPESLAGGTYDQSYIVTVRTARGSAYGGLAEEDGRDGSSFSGSAQRRIYLDDHLDGVGRWAECLARNLGLPDSVVVAVGEAGRQHDLGKLDPRFQVWMHGGDEVSLASDRRPLAKSLASTGPRARDAARRASAYPPGQRHELLSVALASAAADHADLVRHLVATHHGNGRYRFPPQRVLPPRALGFQLGDMRVSGTSEHLLERLDSGQAELFWNLVRSWGWYGLAWLEAVLRLADHEDSRSPEVAEAARRQS